MRVVLRRVGVKRAFTRPLSLLDSRPPQPALTHDELRSTVRAFVEREINPYVDEWEREGIFPAKRLFKKMGDAGAPRGRFLIRRGAAVI